MISRRKAVETLLRKVWLSGGYYVPLTGKDGAVLSPRCILLKGPLWAGHVDASTTCALGGAYFDTSNLDFVVTIVGTAGLSRPELCFAAALVDLFAELGQYWVSGTGHRQ